jgi:hypothetical protein
VGRSLLAVATWLALHGAVAGQPLPQPGPPANLLPSGLDYTEVLPQTFGERFLVVPVRDRGEVVRRVLRDNLSVVSEQAFDLMGLLDGAGRHAPDILVRGAKFGLVIGSVAYVGGELGGGDPWLTGSAGLAAGLAAGALTDLDWPPSFTLRWGQETPFTLGLGWLPKSAGYPAWQPRFAGHSGRPRYTAGLSLSYTPDRARRTSVELFVDPFATSRDSCAGIEGRLQF